MFNIARWLFALSSSSSTNSDRNRRFCPSVECMEDRSCPAVNVFTGGGMNDLWSNIANWSLGRAPVATDDVQLPANPHEGSTMNGNYTVQSLSVPAVANQTHTLQGTLTVTGNLTWSGQVLKDGILLLEDGSNSIWTNGQRLGTTPASATIIVDTTADLVIGGDSLATNGLYNGLIENFGHVSFSYAEEMAALFHFDMHGISDFYNLDGGNVEFHVQEDSLLVLGDGDNDRFVNIGTISVESGELRFHATFDAGGDISVCCGGTLRVSGGGLLSAAFNVDETSYLVFYAINADYNVTLDHVSVTGLGQTELATRNDGVIFVDGMATLSKTDLDGILDGKGGAIVTVAPGRTFSTPFDMSSSAIRNGLTLHILAGAWLTLYSNDFALQSGSQGVRTISALEIEDFRDSDVVRSLVPPTIVARKPVISEREHSAHALEWFETHQRRERGLVSGNDSREQRDRRCSNCQQR